MSVSIERRVFDPGDDAFAESAWTLKESIRAAEGVLKQRRGFFMDAYRRSRVYALVERGEEDSIVGFAATRRDGYILFLAVASGYRGEGFGEQLIARVAEDYSTVSCHARATNRSAIEFYQHVGFEIQRRVDSYYEDAGDAYYLKLGDGGLREAVSNLFSDGS